MMKSKVKIMAANGAIALEELINAWLIEYASIIHNVQFIPMNNNELYVVMISFDEWRADNHESDSSEV